MTKGRIVKNILDERDYQDRKWGGERYDDKHNEHDWSAYIVEHLGKAITNPHTFRTQMVKVAALAVAAIEWVDRRRT